MLEHVNLGWKKLTKIVNALIDTFNSQRIIQGDGISVQYTDHGTIISIVKDDDQPPIIQQSSSSSNASGG